MIGEEPYIYEGQTISFMTDNESRIKHGPNGKAVAYWTRTPNASYEGYFYDVEATGEIYQFHYPSETLGVVTMFSI